MADQNIVASATSNPTFINLPQEIVVCIDYRGWDITEFHGTRAILEAEGMIPKDTEWPEGYFDLHWNDNQFKYWLRRTRPEGVKGPRKQFENVDWFCLRWNLINRPSIRELEIIRKEKELKKLIYRNSAKGQSEWSKRYDRQLEAQKDKQFQAFKAKITGLVPSKRGRKSTAKEA